MKKLVYLYPHGLQGGQTITLANKFTKDGRLVNLFGSFHVSKENMRMAEDVMTDIVKDIVDNGEKVKLVLVGFSPLVAVMYGWYIKNKDNFPSDTIEPVYYIKELGKEWEEVSLA